MEMIRRIRSIAEENAEDESCEINSSLSLIDNEESMTNLIRLLVDMGNHIGEKLPRNPIDYIIEEIGDKYGVAEITGRTGRVCKDHDGRYVFQRRAPDSSVKGILKDGNIHQAECIHKFLTTNFAV